MTEVGPAQWLIESDDKRQRDASAGLRAHTWQQYVREVLDLCQINCVIDVGANVGQYGSWLRDIIGFRGRIISFEPLPSAYAVLRQKAAQDANWSVRNCALGSAEGELEIHEAAHSDFSSFRTSSAAMTRVFGDRATVAKTHLVRVRPLAALWPELAIDGNCSRILLKLDTQGWDLEVLQGLGDQSLSILLTQSELSVVPLYEGAPDFVEAMQAFAGFGWVPLNLNAVSVEHGQLQALEYDCLFLNQRLRSARPE